MPFERNRAFGNRQLHRIAVVGLLVGGIADRNLRIPGMVQVDLVEFQPVSGRRVGAHAVHENKLPVAMFEERNDLVHFIERCARG